MRKIGNSFNQIDNVWEDCNLGDLRLSKRASTIASKMLEKPNSLIPQQMSSWASTKACYRFLDNPSVSFSSLISPHFRETKKATSEYETVLCIHYTSEISFRIGSQIEGLQRVLAPLLISRCIFSLPKSSWFTKPRSSLSKEKTEEGD